MKFRLTSGNNDLPDARQLNEDNVAEGLLGVVSNSNGGEARGRVVGGPLVVSREASGCDQSGARVGQRAVTGHREEERDGG